MSSLANMNYSVDYYSFTILIDRQLGLGMFNSDRTYVLHTFNERFNLEIVGTNDHDTWTTEKAKGFYTYRLRHAGTDIVLSYGATNNHILCECAGKSCNTLDGNDLLDGLIRATADRTTRIDFAVDIETDIDPKTFIEARKSIAFKSTGSKRSPTGRTEYLGGRSSERMARVYRYEPPHPRSKFLRVEAEYKGAAAKTAARHLVTAGLIQACLDAHSAFQWSHATWTPADGHYGKIPYSAYNPSNANTVHWLYGTVITALSKAIKMGLINLDEWLESLREGLKDKN